MENNTETVGQLLLKYMTDKNHGTIKNIFNNLDDRIIIDNAETPIGHTYGDSYQEIFSNYEKNSEINLMEIGVQRGGSLKAWRDFFPKANIYGVDIIDVILPEYRMDDITYIFNDIKDASVTEQLKDVKFDIIIDDGSHFLPDVIAVCNTYLPQLNKGGVLIVEDCQRPEQWLNQLTSITPNGYSVSVRDLRAGGIYSGDNYLIVIENK